MMRSGWIKSSRSGSGNDHCVEIRLDRHGVAIRDSKDRSGPRLWQDSAGWARFLVAVRDGAFDE